MATHDDGIPNPHEPSRPFIIVNLSSCPKLAHLTYLAWYTQIESLLIGFDLLKYVDGSHPCPSPTITTPPSSDQVEQKTISNPEYFTWVRQDKLLLGALLGTLSPTIASLVVHVPTSYDVWTTLSTTYANPSRGHILQVKDHLAAITKSTTTISEYMQQIKECTDKLLLMGKPMDHEDIISKVLNGLDYDTCKPIIDSIRARDDPISFEALHEKLILHELSVKNTTSASTNHVPATAYVASRRNLPPNRFSNRTPELLPTPTTSKPPNEFKGRCQWCRDFGHVISHCEQFTQLFPHITFPSPTPRQNTSQRPYHNRPTPPRAHMSHHPSPNSSPWLLDSGATHHITNDLANLSLHSPYAGTDELIIGDGSTLPIANIGSSIGKDSTTRTP